MCYALFLVILVIYIFCFYLFVLLIFCLSASYKCLCSPLKSVFVQETAEYCLACVQGKGDEDPEYDESIMTRDVHLRRQVKQLSSCEN